MKVDFFDILKKMAGCQNIQVTFIKKGDAGNQDLDLGIRKTLLDAGEKEYFMNMFYSLEKGAVLYYITDFFETEYCAMPIPDGQSENGEFIILGPYRSILMDEAKLNELLEEKSIPRAYTNELKEYYNAIPMIGRMDQWHEFCITLFWYLHSKSQSIHTEYIRLDTLRGDLQTENQGEELSFKIIEQRYAAEGELLKAIADGNTEEALKTLSLMRKYKISARYKDPVRDTRNGLVIFNTLMRKAAEAGGVHPAHIDELSTQLAKRIESVSSQQESIKFMTDMVRKYCMMVRNYSLRGRSPVIQKVVNHINLNLTEDLSLKRLAGEYSVNASYLSALFKKEMEVNLTEYISQQRIRRAITLLNSTNMQIQDIASESGIYDVNYFRKIFKKTTGMTPTEYSKQIRKQYR